jgi:hypothetical protein
MTKAPPRTRGRVDIPRLMRASWVRHILEGWAPILLAGLCCVTVAEWLTEQVDRAQR